MQTLLVSQLALVALALSLGLSRAETSDYARFVNPLIGTAAGGHTFPGATVPFGLVQVSPDTGNAGWDYCAGYRYEDSSILGFSHTHLSGTGCSDLGDILLLPFSGQSHQAEYKSRFSHQHETALPGYYSVELLNFGVKAELTASPHCAFHRYSFGRLKEGHLLIDLQSGLVGDPKELEDHVLRSELQFEDAQTLSGFHITRGWGGERHVYFVIRFKTPIVSSTWLSGGKQSRNQRVVLDFKSESPLVIQAQVALSTVDIAGARANLAAEMSGWDFAAAAAKAYAEWNQYLSKIRIQAPRQQMETFYTAFYHTGVAPNNIADVDGRYRGPDNNVYEAPDKTYYSTLSLWDVHRALIPLYTIVCPERVNRLADTMLRHFDVAGYLPMWTLWGHENHCMIGNPSIPVLAEAYLTGILSTAQGLRAYEAARVSSTKDHPKSDWTSYTRYGYLPSDIVQEEAVSRTLEFAFDDWCVAAMAQAMGRTNDAALFGRRATFYRNLFDPSTGLMRGKKSDGSWVKPFDALKISHAGDAGGDYTEANAWQYTWHVQQCPQDLLRLMGGDGKFAARLDQLFALPSKVYGDGAVVDVTGLIGQYVQGNEPSHHVAYLYSFAGMPWKTQERVHQILTTLYNNTPGGICGNDDCGQMSAWYLLSAMGFYPVNPVNGLFVLGSPSVESVSIDVGNGKGFDVQVVRQSPDQFYIDHLERDGKAYPYSYFAYQDIMRGGTFRIYMGSKPNRAFGRAAQFRPQAAAVKLDSLP